MSEVGANVLIAPIQAKQEILEPEVHSNLPMQHELSGMLDITQMDHAGYGSMPNHYDNVADGINACKSPMTSIQDDDPWEAFINDAIWPTDSQQL